MKNNGLVTLKGTFVKDMAVMSRTAGYFSLPTTI
jgi:hypothetical protein